MINHPSHLEDLLIVDIEKKVAELYFSNDYPQFVKQLLLIEQPEDLIKKQLSLDTKDFMITQLPILQFVFGFFLLEGLRYLYKESGIDQKEFIKEHKSLLKQINRHLEGAFKQPMSQSLYAKALFIYSGEWSLDFPEVDPNYEKKINNARIILQELEKEDYKPARFWLAFILTETNQQQAGVELHYLNAVC
jgi:hypothetical protein